MTLAGVAAHIAKYYMPGSATFWLGVFKIFCGLLNVALWAVAPTGVVLAALNALWGAAPFELIWTGAAYIAMRRAIKGGLPSWV